MNRIFYFIIISICFYACKPGIPKDILQPDKMQQVLIDIHLVDGYISTLPSLDTAKKVGSSFYKGIYKKYDIDSAIYNTSINYYYKHPDLMKKMYDSISVKLGVLREKNAALVDDLTNISFKGIFSIDKSDTLLVDRNLNKKYNIPILKKNVYANFGNQLVIGQPNVAPVSEQVPISGAAPPVNQPQSISAPVQEVQKTQQ
jgi:Domain of unknown function (DUF4296)